MGCKFLIFWWGLGQVGHEIAIPSYTSNKKGIGFTHSYTNIHYEIANVLFFVFFGHVSAKLYILILLMSFVDYKGWDGCCYQK